MRLTFGDLAIDCERRQLMRRGGELHLSGKAFALLELLLQRRPNAVKRADIISHLWPDTFVSPSNLATLVQEIRDVLSDDARHPRFVRTIFAYGYAFVAEEDDGPPAAGARPVRSIAVLPFRMAGADDAEYVADGITDSVIDALAEDPELRVMARSTVFRFQHSDRTPHEIGRELRVDAVVAAGIRRHGDRVTVAAELVSVEDGARLWGGRYERSASEVMGIEDDLARGISAALQLDRAPRGKSVAGRRRDDAHALYLRARHAMNQRSAASIRSAADDLRHAIAIDPQYAPPHAALADTFTLAARYVEVPALELAAAAREAAARALELDASLPDAHISMASVHDTCDWNWSAAEREYREAIALRPGDALAHQWYALLLTRLGRSDEAGGEIRTALRLDPLSPRLNLAAANIHYYAGRFDDAASSCAKALALDPAFPFAYLQMALIHLQQERYGQARAALETSGDSAAAVAARAMLHAREGETAPAGKLMAQLVARGADYELAVVAAALDRDDLALQSLQTACERRNVYASYAGVDPLLASLRADRRFAALLRKASLRRA